MQSKLKSFYNYFKPDLSHKMDMQQAQMEFEQEDYQSAYTSTQTDTFTELLLAATDDRLIDLINKLKGDSDKFSSLFGELKEYASKKKDSVYLKNLEMKILQLMANLKENERYAETDRQRNILWFFDKICCNDKIIGINSKTEEAFLKIFMDFSSFDDFPSIIKLARHMYLNARTKNAKFPFSERLHNLYHEKYEKLQSQQQAMKFGKTMKNLNEEKKIMVKVQIINFFSNDFSKWKIEENEVQKLLVVLKEKPYTLLFKNVVDKKLKHVRHLRSSILKAKMELIDEKIELIFGAKCELCKELQTKETLELTAKHADGNELIPEFDPESLILQGDYIYTKWSSEVLISAKQKVSYDSSEEQLNEGFLKLLSYFKKIFEHKKKHILELGSSPKIIEEDSHDKAPQGTINYICHFLQLFVRFLSFNSLEINHRSHNLSELIPVSFLDEVFEFFEKQLKNIKTISESEQNQKMEKKEDEKNPKIILKETIDYLITFVAHLFYRRDFQSITSLTSKTSQTIVRILLQIESFPTKWNVLRNYKLVIDRWGESVEEGSEEYKKLTRKFLDSYFSDKVTVYSKSSSTVFNPIFITRPYCKIFGTEFLKCVESFEKQLDEIDAKSNNLTVSRQMNSKMSKIILFMSARVRFQEVNKIAEHMGNIYRKYAHIIPQIYSFRAWISQINLTKTTQQQISTKLIECLDVVKTIHQNIKGVPANTLITSVSKFNEEENAQIIKLLNLYKNTHFRALNSLELKSRTEEYGQNIYHLIWQITKEHIEMEYTLGKTINSYSKQNKQDFELIKEENDLLVSQGNGSIYSTIQEVKNNLLCLERYYICNAQKLLTPKDYAALVGVIGSWIRESVTQTEVDQQKFNHSIKQIFIVFAFKLTSDIKSHLMKKQILGAMRALNGGQVLDLTRHSQLHFNQVFSLYEQVKPVYSKLIKLLIQQNPHLQKRSKQELESKDITRQILQNLILPTTYIQGPCNFNGKIEQKGSEDMVLGLFLDQAESIFKNFSVEDLLKLNENHSLFTMLQITKNKGLKVSEQKSSRNNPQGIFNRQQNQHLNRNQTMDELRQLRIPEDYIQLALQNIPTPNPHLALEWIQNNQDRMQNLLMQKVMRESKQQTMMKSMQEPKLQVGKITPMKYQQFIENLQKSMKGLVKNLAKQLFSEKGKQIVKVLFIVLDAFKDDFKKKQYVNFAKKMFEEINGLNGQNKFNDKKYQLILRILNFTMRKQPDLFKDYYKEGICLKVLSFVGSFANGLATEEEKTQERRQDCYHLLEIVNKTLPEWKSPIKKVKPQLIIYLNCLLDFIELANVGGQDVWEILYKISLLQNGELRAKTIQLFSHITVSKQIMEQEKMRLLVEEKFNQNKNLLNKVVPKTLAIKIFMLPLAKLLLEQDEKLMVANIQLQIKGHIAENYKYDLSATNQTDAVIEIDLKRFLNSFDKFFCCKEFEEVFKKLFTKKKNKKTSIFYDVSKHSVFESEFIQENQRHSFVSMKYDSSIEEILKTLITRPVINETDRELQEQALIELYKFLDFFKVLIPTALRTQWWSQTDGKKTNLLEWLICRSFASNKKKFQFLTFLAMNNHLLINKTTTISDFVCNEYLNIFRSQIQSFRLALAGIKEGEQSENSTFKEESQHELRFKRVFYNFMYLLQVDKFNAQCFLTVNQTAPIRELLEKLLVNLNPSSTPIIYTLVGESIFILRKREMIELLKQKYELVSHQQLNPAQPVNNYLTQFLNMNLIYKVDPGSFNETKIQLKNSRKRNIFSGSSGRIIVDEVDDNEEADMNIDEMDEEGDYNDSINRMARLRYLNGNQRIESRNQGNDESYLHPIETLPINNVTQSIQPQQPQSSLESNQQAEVKEPEDRKQKMQEQPKAQTQSIQPMSKLDYAKILQEQSEKLEESLILIRKLLPDFIYLTHQALSTQKIVVLEKEKMISEDQDNIKSESTNINAFSTSLSNLIDKVSVKTSEILPQNSRFQPNAQIKPEFISRLVLNDGIQKLSKFQKRLKSIITTFSPEIKSSVWQNDYTSLRSGSLMFDQEGRQIPSARWLMSRLERQDSGENRDQILYHIERLISQRREEPRQQNSRPRILNLSQAIQDLPQQPEPPKVEQKPKQQQNKPQKKQEEAIKPQTPQDAAQNKIVDLPVEEKIVEEKSQEVKQEVKPQTENQIEEKKQEKMEEQKPQVESKAEQKLNEAPKGQMVEQQQVPQQQQNIEISEPIIPQQLEVPLEAQLEPPQQFINEPVNTGPYRQILAMFGLSQTFLADNGIDPQSFDCLPEQFQIDQITHYMNQAQNRNAINQLNQANLPNNNNPQPQGQNQEGAQQAQPRGNNVNQVLQQNIALFASMDPQTRMQMLADYPPEFLMQLPVQMRTQVQQYRQRQLHRFVEEEEDDTRLLRDDYNLQGANRKIKKLPKSKQNAKYPTPSELQFNPISESLGENLSKGLFLKIEKSRVIQGFRILLQNYLTQEPAIATVIAILRQQEGLKLTHLEYKSQNSSKDLSKLKQKNKEISQKGYWKCQSSVQTETNEINSIKESLLNLIYETLNNSLYKNEDFLIKKVPYENYLKIKIEPQTQLEADENGFWPLYELLPYSLQLCPKLTIEILKKVEKLPVKLIKKIVQAIRSDKLTPEIYKQLEFLSKNEDMKTLFMEEFPQSKPLKLQIFAKIIKYEFAKVPYLRKLHEQALNYYSSEYNEFLNQIFGIYTASDIKEIQSLLVKHKHVHFQVIKYLYSQNRVLDKEPIGIILKMPHLLDFQTKKYLFRKHPKIRRASRYRLPIEVNRTNILQESYNQIMSKTPKQLEGRLQITFMDEQGYDAGGLTREWLLCLSREIFRPDYALFEPSSSGNTYQPNPKSYVNPDHLQYFKFIGRFVGKALAQNELVDAYFTRAFYKMILGQQVELSDLEQQDYAFYKSMLWLKQNAIEKGDYTFSYLYDNFGQRIVKDLIPNGRNLDVTEENKLEYIEKYCLAKMRDDFKAQMEKFLEGFHQIVPHQCINFFEAKELELLISGLPEINFEDLRNNVDYSGYSPTDQGIKWFWEIIEEFTQEDLARLIQFITGTSKIPVDGFANIKGMNGPQRISIHKDPNNHQLPKAHTCFNQLDLPNYETKELMRERIVTAITWGSEGFGFM